MAKQACGCPADHKHCKGGVRHTHYKDQMRMVTKAREHVCPAAHCIEALCSCVIEEAS